LASTAAGSLVVTGGYIPAPASPDVAAAYLTITNNGDIADRLEKVTSSVTKMVMAMTETDTGGVGSMTDLPDVTIPAHGSMQFVPGHAHLMLEKPEPLEAGDQVALTLTFAHAGTVQLTLPVIPLTETP
jgi:copper(I)-binding protein